MPALPHCGVRSAWIGAQSPLHPSVQVLLAIPQEQELYFHFFRAPSSLWEENKERLALAERFARRQFGDFGHLGKWELQPRQSVRQHAGGGPVPAVVAILPPLHPPPVWTHIPWIEQGAHFEGGEGWVEEPGGRKGRKRVGRSRRKGSQGDQTTGLSGGVASVQRSVSLHSRAGRERIEKVTKKLHQKS